jgi:hypothetical protein
MPSQQEKLLLVVDVDSPQAEQWADMYSIARDLDSAIQVCGRLIELLPSNDQILIESLWTSALIKYARCFSEGKRFGLPIDVFDGLEGDPKGTHQYYIDMRNKHLAHSVNPFEQVKIGLVLSDPKVARKIVGTVQFSQFHISAKEDGVRTLRSLCSVLKKKLGGAATERHEAVLAHAKTLDIKQLYQSARMRTVAPGPADAGLARE